MRSALAVLFTLATSAFSYQVLSPGGSVSWTNDGSQLVTWSRVDTDPRNFTIVLDNQSVDPRITFVLAALVDGTQTPPEAFVNPPSGGWPTGEGFRVNFVRDDDNLEAILAQSQEFEIQDASTLSGSSTSRRPTSTSSFVISATSSGIVPNPNTTPNPSGSDDSDGSTNPPGNNGAMSSAASVGLASIFALAGYLLA
ncbi:hypothetical protein AX16_000978 [Volvariella volvacea WC 439]|nr:hypothetical protein AX16_000978 [Volvariella volvacea WC 439]